MILSKTLKKSLSISRLDEAEFAVYLDFYLGSANVNPQVAHSGLTALINAEYGIAMRDSFLSRYPRTVRSSETPTPCLAQFK
jgi:hypothetical protein